MLCTNVTLISADKPGSDNKFMADEKIHNQAYSTSYIYDDTRGNHYKHVRERARGAGKWNMDDRVPGMPATCTF